MKFIVGIEPVIINLLLDATSNAYPHIMFWKNKAYATNGNLVIIQNVPKEFPKKIYIHRNFIPRLIGKSSDMKIRIKDDIVHIRYGNKIVKVEDPFNPSQFPDISKLVKQEKEQEDESISFTVLVDTLSSLVSRSKAKFITMKVHKSLTIGRWKDSSGNRGYFAQASVDEE